MPRTRSAKAKAAELSAELDHDTALDTDETAKPTSFQGRLTKFQYAKRVRPTETNTYETKSTSPPRPKKKRTPSRYADPSKYAHLSPLVDILEPNLICVFVGTVSSP
ncbi:hypothetical protein GQ44DRAFT_761266 [Phaeosphaeriaceae sp. PMI808]|nr:hypothetical protein GQ44DRAFT_761266 [Phaeosphaeriaceae sp. PMI808]